MQLRVYHENGFWRGISLSNSFDKPNISVLNKVQSLLNQCLNLRDSRPGFSNSFV